MTASEIETGLSRASRAPGRRTTRMRSGLLLGITLQVMQYRQIGVARRADEVVVRNIGDGDKADMGVFAVESATGQRLVEVLEPMGADKVGVVGDFAEIARIGPAALALAADPEEPLPEQPAIDRPEVELADHGRLAEHVETRPFGGIIGDRAPVAIEADDVAPAGAGLDRFPGL